MTKRDLYYAARQAARKAQYLECFKRGRDWQHDAEAAAYGVAYHGPKTAQATEDLVALIVYSLTHSDDYHAETYRWGTRHARAKHRPYGGNIIPVPSPIWWQAS